MAKKAKRKIVMRREYTNADVKELRAHSKAKTPVVKIAIRWYSPQENRWSEGRCA